MLQCKDPNERIGIPLDTSIVQLHLVRTWGILLVSNLLCLDRLFLQFPVKLLFEWKQISLHWTETTEIIVWIGLPCFPRFLSCNSVTDMISVNVWIGLPWLHVGVLFVQTRPYKCSWNVWSTLVTIIWSLLDSDGWIIDDWSEYVGSTIDHERLFSTSWCSAIRGQGTR